MGRAVIKPHERMIMIPYQIVLCLCVRNIFAQGHKEENKGKQNNFALLLLSEKLHLLDL